MKKSWLVMFTFLFGFMSMVQVAEAKRFGGGSSFGYSKSVPSKSYNTAPKSTAAKPAATSAGKTSTSGASKWLGPLAGLAAGGLLAAMLFGDGFEGFQIMDFLILGLIAFVLFKVFAAARMRQTQQPNYQSAYVEPSSPLHSADSRDQSVQRRQSDSAQTDFSANGGESIIGSALGEAPSSQAQSMTEVPEWFDAEQFLQGAKGHFVTLQKAWDDLDVTEIESYCTPELFAEIKQQMQGRVSGDNHTVVDTLYAEMADMALDGEYFVVSVRFSGFIEEEAGAGAHAFREIWHIRRKVSNQGDWLVAGIQQEI